MADWALRKLKDKFFVVAVIFGSALALAPLAHALAVTLYEGLSTIAKAGLGFLTNPPPIPYSASMGGCSASSNRLDAPASDRFTSFGPAGSAAGDFHERIPPLAHRGAGGRERQSLRERPHSSRLDGCVHARCDADEVLLGCSRCPRPADRLPTLLLHGFQLGFAHGPRNVQGSRLLDRYEQVGDPLESDRPHREAGRSVRRPVHAS